MRELGDGAVQLSREALGSVVARGFDGGRELLDSRLGKPVRSPVDDARKLIDLPALDVGEAPLDPAHSVGLFGGDPLAKLTLALAQPLRNLVQRPSALALVYLDLTARNRPGLAGGALELLPQLREDRALIFAGRLQLLHLRFQPRLSLGDRLALALRELGEPGRQPLLDPVQVAGPLSQPLLDAALDERKGLAELAGDPPFLLGQFVAPGFGELSLVFGKARARFGACPRERALELLASLQCLALDQLPERCLGLLQLGVDPPAPRQPFTERQCQQGSCAAHGQSTRGHRRPSIDIECEGDPSRRRRQTQQARQCGMQATRAPARQCRRNRHANQHDACGEGDLHGGLRGHQRWIVDQRKRRTSSAAASDTLAAVMKRSAVSGARVSVSGPIGIREPSVRSIVPVTETVLRLTSRTTVDSTC
ncbi:MAG TPA: hypothetical protein VE055_05360 [Gaiellaceae bacterium]|nr:hypothetical protein [Gaiellaceae bacterium]